MNAKVFIVMLLIACAAVFSCSEELGENDYFDRANQYMADQNWQEAEANFAKISSDFPNGVHASKSMFMVGYINANHLNNLSKAEEYYNSFLAKYPEHELADDAQYELEHLGKDVDELPFLQDGGESPSASSGDDNAPAQN